MQTGSPLTPFSQLPLEALEASFRQELAEAESWYAKVRQDERDWLEQGKDPEAEFVRKYYAEPSVATHWREGLWAMAEANPIASLFIVGLSSLGAVWLVRRWRRRRRIIQAAA